MESIKHKMMCLQRETSDAFQKAEQLQYEGSKFIKECDKFDKLILEINKEINQKEDNLDCHLTSYKELSEKLEITSKEGNEFELQVKALKRRVALVEGERQRTAEKQKESECKLEEYQAIIAEEEDEVKLWDTRGIEAEDDIESMEMHLEEARRIMEESNQKHEDIKRRLNVVEAECERAGDRAEEVESRNKEMEIRISDLKVNKTHDRMVDTNEYSRTK